MRSLLIQSPVNTTTMASLVTGTGKLRDERWLVARAKSGHEDAFAELYKRHQGKAYHTALRILRNRQDAEDVMQRAFHRVLVNMQRFREDSTFSTWLTRIAINEALMLLRQRRTRRLSSENNVDAEQGDHATEIIDGAPTPEELFSENERRATLLEAVAKLRKSLRVVVLHRELKGLTNAETAAVLGLTVGAVKARTFHARRFLRKHLERKFVAANSLAKLRKTKA